MLNERPVETTHYSLQDSPPLPEERRSDERHLTLFRVGSLTIEGRRELCLIRNVSAGGMLIRPYRAIRMGQVLTVELKQGEPVTGVARWIKDDCVGVEFDEPIDVIELLTASSGDKRPRMPRVEVSCMASIRQDADVHKARVLDVSQGGIKVESESGLEIGADVIVSLAGLEPVPAVVRWSDSQVYGINFNRILPLPLLVAWLQEQRERMRAAG